MLALDQRDLAAAAGERAQGGETVDAARRLDPHRSGFVAEQRQQGIAAERLGERPRRCDATWPSSAHLAVGIDEKRDGAVGVAG